MIFGSGYGGSSGGYHANPEGYLGGSAIEAPIGPKQAGDFSMSTGDLGMSVIEGSRFGTLIDQTQSAIRLGVRSIELATIQGGGEPGGAEGYGHEAREALRELARANDVYFTSVHSPTSVGNLSGFNPQEHGFSDEFRHREMEEVKKAIEFAGDVGGGAVVVHTGEAMRDISEAPWNKELYPGMPQFLGYNEEPGRQPLYMVDDRTGRVISEVRKSQTVFEPDYEKKVIDGKEYYIDQDGNPLQNEQNFDQLFLRVPKWDPDRSQFKTVRRTWDFFKEKADRWNNEYPRFDDKTGEKKPWTAEEMFYRTQMETQILQSRGHSLFYGRQYEEEVKSRNELMKAYDYYQKLEETLPEDEVWKIMQEDRAGGRAGYALGHLLPSGEKKKPTELLFEAIRQQNMNLKHIREASAAADAQADQLVESLHHVKPVVEYAKDLSFRSFAEAGIHAFEQTKNNQHVQRDVFVAPENIFPEMGYGSHPQELIELVLGARKKMVELLTEKTISSRHERRDENGNLIQEVNPFYMGINKKEAEEYAKRHIKATFDTQHMGMWWKHFQPLPGETKDQRRDRFKSWYMEQIDQLAKNDVIGHIHAVDSLGGGHHHLPLGQGDIPIKETIEYLRKKGFKGTIISEGHEENRMSAGRQMTASWRYLGSNIVGTGFGMGATGATWTNVHNSYFKSMQSPYFIFGSYSPSNDWQLWTQMPME